MLSSAARYRSSTAGGSGPQSHVRGAALLPVARPAGGAALADAAPDDAATGGSATGGSAPGGVR